MTRREFLSISAAAACTLIVSTGLSGCGSSNNDSVHSAAAFNHGVASGDPQTDKVIIWTRATPQNDETELSVTYEVAGDEAFANILHNGTAVTNADRDYTVKIDVQNLKAGTPYYYRFRSGKNVSAVGKTKTLPEGAVASVKMAVFSCANYPKGYFNAYAEAAKKDDIDVALQLGDYIYEYGMLDENGNPAYATENAAAIGRVLPADNDTELLSLDDYRKRYALYHTDSGLQALNAAVPFIAVWDDHEVANDAYKSGAENHDPATEGSFDDRKTAALKAYFEWLPIRPASSDDESTIYRSFDFGDLVALDMLDTRIIGRDKQLSYADYMIPDGEGGMTLDAAAFTAALTDENRSMMGTTQLQWLQQRMATATATWHVLGQQVLMGRMNIPAELLTLLGALEGDLDDTTKTALLSQLQSAFGELAQIKGRMLRDDPMLTPEEMARVTTVAPYNLDAWDGYFMERERVLGAALANDKNLVVLAGDTHNSWANDLKALNPTTHLPEYQAGVEFAVTSVTSPGLEEYVGLSTTEAAMQFEQVLDLLIDDLHYCNLNNRGLMTVTFTPSKAEAEWFFVDNIDSETYGILSSRSQKLAVEPGAGNRKLIKA